jgi:hypothetical protein
MKCPNCGHRNDGDAQFCEKCGETLKSGLSRQGIPSTPVKSEGMSTSTKLLIVAVIVLVAGLGLTSGVLLEMNKGVAAPNNTTNSVTQSPTQVTYEAKWHESSSFSGINNDYRSFNIKGSRFKVVMSAMPLLNYNTNSMSIDISNANNIITSGTIDWTPTESLSQKEKTIEVTSGPGTYRVNIFTKDLESWTVKLYDYY